MLDAISVLLNLFRFVLWPSIWSILEDVPCVLGNHIYSSFWMKCSQFTQLCQTLGNPMSIPGFPVHHQLLELTQTHVTIELVMPSNRLILCCPILFPLSVFPRIRVFPSDISLHIRWPKYWSISFNMSPSDEYSGLILLGLTGLISLWSSSVQLLSRVWLFVTPWMAACQASLSITNSWSLPKPMSIESMMPSNHLILCCPLLLLPSILPSIRVFSNESALHIKWPMYWSFSFNISPSNEHPGLISYRM